MTRQRITIAMLERQCEYLNRLTNSPEKPYVPDESGRMRAQVGNFHLYEAYGGVCLHRMQNENGGVNCPLGSSCVPKRELFEAMWNFIRGPEFAADAAE